MKNRATPTTAVILSGVTVRDVQYMHHFNRYVGLLDYRHSDQHIEKCGVNNRLWCERTARSSTAYNISSTMHHAAILNGSKKAYIYLYAANIICAPPLYEYRRTDHDDLDYLWYDT